MYFTDIHSNSCDICKYHRQSSSWNRPEHSLHFGRFVEIPVPQNELFGANLINYQPNELNGQSEVELVARRFHQPVDPEILWHINVQLLH